MRAENNCHLVFSQSKAAMVRAVTVERSQFMPQVTTSSCISHSCTIINNSTTDLLLTTTSVLPTSSHRHPFLIKEFTRLKTRREAGPNFYNPQKHQRWRHIRNISASMSLCWMQITLNPFILSLKVTVANSDPTPSCAFIVKERSLRMLGTSLPKPLRSMNTVRCLTLAIPSTLQDQIVTVLSCELRLHVNIFGADFVTNGTPMSGSSCRLAEGARKLTRPPWWRPLLQP